jgi:hypothetical protein
MIIQSHKKNNIQIKLLSFFLIGLVTDILYFPVVSDIRYFSLLFIWFMLVQFFRLTSVESFKLVLGLLFLLFIFYLFDKDSQTNERIATWIYLLLLFGVIQQFIELNKEKNRVKS